jgi:hypothetical protein
MRVWEFIVQWALLMGLEDRPITLAEYREFWGEPLRTAARHQAEFRELFGEGREGYSDPGPIAAELVERMGRERFEAWRELRATRHLRPAELPVSELLGATVSL